MKFWMNFYYRYLVYEISYMCIGPGTVFEWPGLLVPWARITRPPAMDFDLNK